MPEKKYNKLSLVFHVPKIYKWGAWQPNGQFCLFTRKPKIREVEYYDDDFGDYVYRKKWVTDGIEIYLFSNDDENYDISSLNKSKMWKFSLRKL